METSNDSTNTQNSASSTTVASLPNSSSNQVATTTPVVVMLPPGASVGQSLSLPQVLPANYVLYPHQPILQQQLSPTNQPQYLYVYQAHPSLAADATLRRSSLSHTPQQVDPDLLEAYQLLARRRSSADEKTQVRDVTRLFALLLLLPSPSVSQRTN